MKNFFVILFLISLSVKISNEVFMGDLERITSFNLEDEIKGVEYRINNITYKLNKNNKVFLNNFSSEIECEMNNFQTLTEDISFKLQCPKDSIAYFGSFDKNAKVYIAEGESTNYKRVNDKFINIEQNKLYQIKTSNVYTTVLQKYVQPKDLSNNEINIKNDEQSFLYLLKDKTYEINFGQNTLDKIIKLSDKTFDSKIKIYINDAEVDELSKSKPYYKLSDKFNDKLKLNVLNGDAFIEFLSKVEKTEFLNEINKKEYIIQQNRVAIRIDLTQKNFVLNFKSDKNIKYSLSLGLSNDDKYFYISSANSVIDSKKNEVNLQYLSLFKYLNNLLKEEFIYLSIYFEKEENQQISISYSQSSSIDSYLDEEMSQDDCNKIINNIIEALNVYIYTDIAKMPPKIPGLENYHHERVDMIEELRKISITNRKFYEFYQDINRIIGSTRDGHLGIYPERTIKGIIFDELFVFLPCSFVIKPYNGEQRIFITENSLTHLVPENIQNFIKSHLDTPLKTINDIDPFDYFQNIGNDLGVKCPHGGFTLTITMISGFYLFDKPMNFSSFCDNEFEFENFDIIRLSYYISPPKNNEIFHEYFRKTLDSYSRKFNYQF